MSKLVIENVDEELLLKLRSRAGEHGVSIEEEHLQILVQALKDGQEVRSGEKKPSFAEHLLHGGESWPDDFIPGRSRNLDEHRKVQFA